MRLWSVHPQYLDRQGLTACWRESLLAQAVLAGRTKGYRNHSQLIRFRAHPEPLAAVGAYLGAVAEEAARRGYRFDVAKILSPGVPARVPGRAGAIGPAGVLDPAMAPAPARAPDGTEAHDPAMAPGRTETAPAARRPVALLPVTEGQLLHEWAHLSAKLRVRSPEVAARYAAVVTPEPHPLFMVVPGPVEPWERAALPSAGAVDTRPS